MRWPQLTLPSLPSGGLRWPSFRLERTTWIYIGFTLVSFLVFLVITFPHEVIVLRAMEELNRGPVGLRVKTAGIDPLRGYELGGIVLGGEDGEAPWLEAGHVWLRPSLSHLFQGNPRAAVLEAELYGGSLEGHMALLANGFEGAVAWRAIDIGRYPPLAGQLEEGRLLGKLSGKVAFEARGARLEQGQANGEIAIDGAALQGAKIEGIPIPDLKLASTRTKFTVASGRVDLLEFVATGDVNIEGSGQIQVRDPVGQSSINLKVTVTSTPQTPDAIKAALSLIPRPPGSKADSPLTIYGTLEQPRLR